MHPNFAMAGIAHPRHNQIKASVAIALSFVAGFVDIVGFISFGHTFAAHMTGNTVHLGEMLSRQQWLASLKAASLIAAFVSGSVFARGLVESAARIHLRSIAILTLTLEAGMIAAAIFCAHDEWFSVLILAGAMGVQTATLTRVGSLTIHTTFVTGMLNKLAQLISHSLFLTYDFLRGLRAAGDARTKIFAQSRFIFSVWFFYLAGAAAGAGARSRWGVPSLLLPIALICALSAIDLIVPLAIEEEGEAFER